MHINIPKGHISHASAFVLFAPTVAVTRAKALLIIVGDPLILGLDPLWCAYLNTVHAGGRWRGRPILWDPDDSVNPDGGYDIDLRMRALGTACSGSLMGPTLTVDLHVFGFASHSFMDTLTQSGGGVPDNVQFCIHR